MVEPVLTANMPAGRHDPRLRSTVQTRIGDATMSVLVVYESIFGNTRLVAEAVARGLSASIAVEVLEVGSAPSRIGPEITLLVVGAPTHAFGLSRPNSRHDAVTKAPSPVPEPETGAREWLGRLERAGAGVRGAAFDTRLGRGWIPGSAARAALRRLAALGFEAAIGPESFYVVRSAGPLADGEGTRAQQWGTELGAATARR